jgi:hypothetical protein
MRVIKIIRLIKDITVIVTYITRESTVSMPISVGRVPDKFGFDERSLKLNCIAEAKP